MSQAQVSAILTLGLFIEHARDQSNLNFFPICVGSQSRLFSVISGGLHRTFFAISPESPHARFHIFPDQSQYRIFLQRAQELFPDFYEELGNYDTPEICDYVFSFMVIPIDEKTGLPIATRETENS